MENYPGKIQDYIDGLLPEEERIDFERELSVNEELQQATRLQQELNQVIRKQLAAEKGVAALQQQLRQTGEGFFGQPARRTAKLVRMRRTLAVVAAAACILFAVLAIGIFNRTDLEALPAMINPTTRGAAAAGQYDQAVAAFNQHRYAQAASLLEQVMAAGDSSAATGYYLGLARIGEKQYAKALEVLVPVARGNSVYKPDAAYFSGLAAYKTGNALQSRLLLQEVPASGAYHKKAQQLLKKLD